MKAKIVRVAKEYDGGIDDDTISIMFDFKKFETINLSLQSANYYDKAGKPTLKCSETKHYPKDCREGIYFSLSYVNNNGLPFDVIEQ